MVPALLLLLLVGVIQGSPPQSVTCGSTLKLLNVHHKVRLHSHEVKYGSGSGQQSVTGNDHKEDVNSHWVIKGPTNKLVCPRGEVIKCGQEIRLEHLATKKNLHSHHFSSPLSNSQEVSAFGDEGEGDTGDVWTVVCDGEYWSRDATVMFKHSDTSALLASSGQTFGRPISGQKEIVGVMIPDVSCRWKSAEGLYIHPNDFNPKKHVIRDEL
ncbi:stromal cell-derived factor 2 [Lepeophtheirus salmonis]|uniref:stromal cell-derived factor 2 n=1 Tax=Lepeophtheirus salmonis TaxID=72036 RepID=UPI00077EFE52|nr:stromal cell-derived factor 2-like [Lepeophtheirus salmonis]